MGKYSTFGRRGLVAWATLARRPPTTQAPQRLSSVGASPVRVDDGQLFQSWHWWPSPDDARPLRGNSRRKEISGAPANSCVWWPLAYETPEKLPDPPRSRTHAFLGMHKSARNCIKRPPPTVSWPCVRESRRRALPCPSLSVATVERPPSPCRMIRVRTSWYSRYADFLAWPPRYGRVGTTSPSFEMKRDSGAFLVPHGRGTVAHGEPPRRSYARTAWRRAAPPRPPSAEAARNPN